jgi:hypothetical protein
MVEQRQQTGADDLGVGRIDVVEQWHAREHGRQRGRTEAETSMPWKRIFRS